MRIILVGSERGRDILRWRLRDSGVAVVGEFPTLAAAQASGIDADGVMLTPGAADSSASATARPPVAAAGDVSTPSPGSAPSPGRPARSRDSQDDQPDALTPRELAVLELLAEGLPNKAIAERLGISDQTVKFHVAQITSKLGVANRTEAVRRALRKGILAI